MIAGKRFVIAGLSRLTTRVARVLAARHAEVTVIRGAEGQELVSLLDASVRVQEATSDRASTLRQAEVASATCLLALADDDMANLQVAVTARQIAPDVPVVLRCFDPTLADQLEQGLNVRRAYSVSALSAPAFVAAALDEEVIETMHLGDAEVPLCRLSVRAGSPLSGKTARELKQQFRCGVLAHAGADGGWRGMKGQRNAGGERIEAGEQVLVGGLLHDVLELARRNSRLFERAPGRSRRGPPLSSRSRRHPVTLLPWVGAALALLLALAVIVFAATLHLHPIDALYFVVTTATTTGYGDISLHDAPGWLKLFGCAVMVSGGALLAVLFSHLASVVTAERLEEQMGRRARRLSGHVVVAGLGNVGYRVERLLSDLGIRTAVVELAPDARFVEAVRERSVVLSGDARLPENLQRTTIQEAVAFLACTNDDLTNVQACLHARRLNPNIRTVARIFDDQLAEHLTSAFQIDVAISSGKITAGAFVGAATDERALRPFRLADLEFIAFRYDATGLISLEQIEAWRDQGIRILAFRRQAGAAQPPSELVDPLEPGDAAIIAGPEEAIQTLLFESSPALSGSHPGGDTLEVTMVEGGRDGHRRRD